MMQSSGGTRPKVIVAIPCLNTKGFIEDVVSGAKKHVDQVITVDDGSHDGTAEVASAAGALVISHSRNRGYGEAIKSCFRAARAGAADVLVTLDGDGQHNPDEIPRLLLPILQGEADMIIGSRFLSDEASVPGYRRFGIRVITFLFNLGSRTKVSDAQSGFRSYHRNLFSDLVLAEKGMGSSIETLEKARLRGAIIREVPVTCRYSSSGRGLRSIWHGLGVALAVIKIRCQSLFRRQG